MIGFRRFGFSLLYQRSNTALQTKPLHNFSWGVRPCCKMEAGVKIVALLLKLFLEFGELVFTYVFTGHVLVFSEITCEHRMIMNNRQ